MWDYGWLLVYIILSHLNHSSQYILKTRPNTFVYCVVPTWMFKCYFFFWKPAFLSKYQIYIFIFYVVMLSMFQCIFITQYNSADPCAFRASRRNLRAGLGCYQTQGAKRLECLDQQGTYVYSCLIGFLRWKISFEKSIATIFLNYSFAVSCQFRHYLHQHWMPKSWCHWEDKDLRFTTKYINCSL